MIRLIFGASLWIIASSIVLAVTPDSIPTAGRSLFDFLTIIKAEDGAFRYDIPTDFRRLIEVILARSGADAPVVGGSSPIVAMFPDGRSLQRADSDLHHPRRVVVFTSHHSPVGEFGFSLRDRLFIGYSPGKNQLEVISYNELAGRFEFQVVQDFAPGKVPSVRYVDRPTCMRCHRAESPIFPPRDWDETNANPTAAAGITWAQGRLDSQGNPGGQGTAGGQGAADVPAPDIAALDGGLTPIKQQVERIWEMNRSVLRADEWQFVQKVWQKGCRITTPLPDAPQFTASDCRAQMLIMGLANKLEISFAGLVVPSEAVGATFLPPAKIRALVQSNFSDGELVFPIYDLAARNPYAGIAPPLDAQSFQLLDEAIRTDVAIGDHIPDATIAADAPGRVPIDDLSKDSDRIVSSIRRLWGNLKDLQSPEQWAMVAAKIPPKDDPKAGRALIDLFLKIRKDPAFSDQPIRRGALLKALFSGLEIAPNDARTSCCSVSDGFPPLRFTDDTIIAADQGVERQILMTQCQACHAAATSLIGFLQGGGTLSDRNLALQILERELKVDAAGEVKNEFCRRLNWTLSEADLRRDQRMPQTLSLRQAMLDKEKKDPAASERRLLMDAGRRVMTRVINDDEFANDLHNEFVKNAHPLQTMAMQDLRAMLLKSLAASDCQWLPFLGDDP